MNAHFTTQQLNAYLHQTLADAQRETLDAHLTGCPTCRAQLGEMSVLQQRIQRELTAELKAVNVPLALTFEALAPQLKHHRRSSMSSARSRSFAVFAIAASAIMLILALNLLTRTNLSPAPAAQSASGPTATPSFTVKVAIQFGDVAYLWSSPLAREKFLPGETIPLSLDWDIRLTGSGQTYTSFAHVLDSQGKVSAQVDLPLQHTRLVNSNLPVEGMGTPGGQVTLPVDLPPGQYKIAVGIYNNQSGERLTTDQGETTAIIGTIEVVAPLARFGNVATLIDAQGIPAELAPDGSVELALQWTISPTAPALTSFVHVLDTQGDQVIAQSDQPLTESEVQTVTLHLPAALTPGTYAIVTGVYNSTTLDRLPMNDGATTITIGTLQTGRPSVRFGSAVTLTEASLIAINPAPQAALGLALHWMISATNSTPLNSFVQVLDAQGNLVAQSDQSLPEMGSPAQSIMLRLPAALAAGTYQIVIGVYDPTTGSRLTTDSGETQVPLTSFQVK